jgi:hypothetical protein
LGERLDTLAQVFGKSHRDGSPKWCRRTHVNIVSDVYRTQCTNWPTSGVSSSAVAIHCGGSHGCPVTRTRCGTLRTVNMFPGSVDE